MTGNHTVLLGVFWFLLILITIFVTQETSSTAEQSAAGFSSLFLIGGWLVMIYHSVLLWKRPVPLTETATVGLLNEKAIHLPQPKYPIAAKAVNADGAVEVYVNVNHNGVVKLARAISGHPILQKAAVEAAYAARFAPVRIAERSLKIDGTLVYNFSRPITVMHIGFELAHAQSSAAGLINFPAIQIAAFLPAEWQEEQTLISRIIEYQTTLREALEPETIPKVDAVDFLRELTDLFDNRFEPNEMQSWAFELGLILGEMQLLLDDKSELPLILADLKNLIASAPNQISAEFIVELEKLTECGSTADLTDADCQMIADFLLDIV